MTRFTDRRESAAVRVFAIARLHDGRTVANAAGKTTANFQLSSSFIILWPRQLAWSACLCVCGGGDVGHTAGLRRKDKPIEMLFGGLFVGTQKSAINGSRSLQGKAVLWGFAWIEMTIRMSAKVITITKGVCSGDVAFCRITQEICHRCCFLFLSKQKKNHD